MTVKDVKDMLKDVPDDTPVMLFNGVGRGSIINDDEFPLFIGTAYRWYRDSDADMHNYTLTEDELYIKPITALIMHADF